MALSRHQKTREKYATNCVRSGQKWIMKSSRKMTRITERGRSPPQHIGANTVRALELHRIEASRAILMLERNRKFIEFARLIRKQ